MVSLHSASAARSTPALAFHEVSFAYGARPVVRELSLTLTRGELVGMLGPNGAGKSTVVRLASGVLRPTRGAITLGGVPLAGLSREAVARRVAVIPQDFSVQFAYTVRQVVELGRLPHLDRFGMPRPADRAAVERALEATGTRDMADRVFNELSGGERQRVLLALALAQETDILLLDEPTAHLDLRHQIEALELLTRLNRECDLTVLAALHDVNLAARFFPRLLVLDGTVVADGPPARVLAPEVIEPVFGLPVHVGVLAGEEHLTVQPVVEEHRTESGAATVVPDCPRVHVLGWGTPAELLMRGLADAGVVFTAGPFVAGDAAHALAARLAHRALAVEPFTSLSAAVLSEVDDVMSRARCVCVAGVPPGAVASALADELTRRVQAGAVVIVLAAAGDADPGATTPLADAPAWRRVVDSGAVRAQTPWEAVERALHTLR